MLIRVLFEWGIDMTSTSDKEQIGTSDLAKSIMKNEKFSKYFSLQQEMIKFAVCVAIKNKLEPVTDEKSITNSQHTAALDPDGDLKFLITSYKNTQTPYKMVEQLAEAGFRFIKGKLDKNEMIEDCF
jgi:hypothetical protein